MVWSAAGVLDADTIPEQRLQQAAKLAGIACWAPLLTATDPCLNEQRGFDQA